MEAKIFMMIFRFNPENVQLTQEQSENMPQAWGSFIGNIAIQEKLVSTHQLGSEGAKIATDGTVESGVHFAEGQTLGGNMIVKAQSLEEAVGMAKECPILLMGGTVEVRSINPMAS